MKKRTRDAGDYVESVQKRLRQMVEDAIKNAPTRPTVQIELTVMCNGGHQLTYKCLPGGKIAGLCKHCFAADFTAAMVVTGCDAIGEHGMHHSISGTEASSYKIACKVCDIETIDVSPLRDLLRVLPDGEPPAAEAIEQRGESPSTATSATGNRPLRPSNRKLAEPVSSNKAIASKPKSVAPNSLVPKPVAARTSSPPVSDRPVSKPVEPVSKPVEPVLLLRASKLGGVAPKPVAAAPAPTKATEPVSEDDSATSSSDSDSESETETNSGVIPQALPNKKGANHRKNGVTHLATPNPNEGEAERLRAVFLDAVDRTLVSMKSWQQRLNALVPMSNGPEDQHLKGLFFFEPATKLLCSSKPNEIVRDRQIADPSFLISERKVQLEDAQAYGYIFQLFEMMLLRFKVFQSTILIFERLIEAGSKMSEAEKIKQITENFHPGGLKRALAIIITACEKVKVLTIAVPGDVLCREDAFRSLNPQRQLAVSVQGMADLMASVVDSFEPIVKQMEAVMEKAK